MAGPEGIEPSIFRSRAGRNTIMPEASKVVRIPGFEPGLFLHPMQVPYQARRYPDSYNVLT